MKDTPIRRFEALRPFSRDHHHGLLLCWKIRKGLKRGIELKRIANYTQWFWKEHLQSHFEDEEQYIFPVLPRNDNFVLQAIAEHNKLKNLFESRPVASQVMAQIEKELSAHIRFEERILFNKIQETATEEQLQEISGIHTDSFCDDWEDEFWS